MTVNAKDLPTNNLNINEIEQTLVAGDRSGYTQAESVPVTNFPCKDFVMHKNGKVCKNGRFIDY